MFLKELIEICIADDMVSLVLWKNKDTPSSTLGMFLTFEKTWVLLSPVSEVCNTLYNAQALWMAL